VLKQGFSAFIDVRIREEAVKTIFNLVGYKVDKVTFDEVLGVLGQVTKEDYQLGAAEFGKARERKAKWDAAEPEREEKRQAEKEKNRAFIRQAFLTGRL
jgi:hypothetical protein